MNLSVLLPVINERDNLQVLIPRLHAVLEPEHLDYEILAIDGGSTDGTQAAARELGARVVAQRGPGYGGALATGFAEARGEYVVTLDADLSHEPAFVAKLWRAREQADIVIASRYARGGMSYDSWGRRRLSRLLNWFLRRLLSLEACDLSSGFRLYRRAALEGLGFEIAGFAVLEEILARASSSGLGIAEVPFTFFPRESGRSHARLLKFGFELLRWVPALWLLRNSASAADYDERAFYSIIPMQRFWQRRRHRLIVLMARAAGRTLDIGCGSSVIIQSLNNAVGLDVNWAKLRFLRRYGIPLIRGSTFALPFRGESFECVISSEVIEHVPCEEVLFDEMWRVLKPGGLLVVGTPDYGGWAWPTIERLYGWLLPWAYHCEHVSRYTRESLSAILARHGFVHEATNYILRGEMVMAWRKPQTPVAGAGLASRA